MQSVILFISGGEIFVILLAILVFFGADKIPDFARMMGKGVREFKKATDDIKREFNENTSGVVDDIKSIQQDLTDTYTKEISEPVQDTVNQTASAVEENYVDPYNYDYYYNNQNYNGGDHGNEYASQPENMTTEGAGPTDPETEPKPAELPDNTDKEKEA